MRFGVLVLATDRLPSTAGAAQQAEARSLDSLWLGEHTHIPSSRVSPFPPGGELPWYYSRYWDPLVGLAAAAATTSRIGLGTAVLQAAQRDPIVTAKALSCIDQLAGGRLTVGVGAGWNAEEAANHGVEWPSRWDRLAESVAAMRTLWLTDQASFRGEHIRFDDVWQWPKPVRSGGPAILIGCSPTAKNFTRVLTWADGWLAMPVAGHRVDQARRLLAAAAELGQQTDIKILVDPSSDRKIIDAWRDLGASEAIFIIVPENESELARGLDAVLAQKTAAQLG